MKESNTPPHLAVIFLRWFCNPDYLPDVEGDLLQFYHRRLKVQGRSGANWSYLKDVLLLFRPGIIRSFSVNQKLNTMDLLKHNLRISVRNFAKYRSSFLINLLGLSTGLACVLLIYLWVQDELKVDQFHTNQSRLYQLRENVNQGGGVITRVTTAGPTAAGLQEDFPEVEKAVTMLPAQRFALSWEERDITGAGIYASEGFFDLFSWELLQGQKEGLLSSPNNIIISDEIANNLFGSTDVIGQNIQFQRGEYYQVAGVFREVPNSSSMQFDFVLPFKKFWNDNEFIHNWYNTWPRTFFLLKEHADLATFNDKVKDLIVEKTEGNAAHRFPFGVKYAEQYLYGNYENGHLSGGRIEYVHLFSAIAIFILLIACINFMNLATARASRRMKEIGVKKTVGATRGMMIFQYLSESFLLMSIAMIIAMVVVWLLLPSFNMITNKSLELAFSATLLMGLLVILFSASLLAGSYPAFYLSKFKPVMVLKGSLYTSTGESWARKGLVTFQFSLSIILIVSVIVIYKQIEFTQSKNLGYEKDNVLLMDMAGNLTDSLTYHTFMTEVERIPGVVGASGSHHDMTGHNGGTYGIGWPGKDPDDRTEFERMFVKSGFIELMGIEIKEGRSFSNDFASDLGKIIFNEAAIAYMGIEDPIGKNIRLWRSEAEIIGVVKDFNFASFHEQVKPIFFVVEDDHTDYVMVKIRPGKEMDAISSIESLHKDFNPGFDLNYRFLDDDYQLMYEAENRVSVLSSYFATIAIIISCLGLFGLASFSLEKRSKEIGIRKVLGSSEWRISGRLIYDLLKMVLIAVLIGLPVSYFITSRWLDGFAFRINLEAWFFVVAGIITVLIAILTVGSQAIKAARLNPVQFLKDE